MLKLKKSIAALAVTAAIIGAATPGTNANPSQSPQATASCTSAIIGGKHKCIARGQYCSRRYQRDYKRYGFSCSKRDRNGRYHLR
jgi:hypothetical protein